MRRRAVFAALAFTSAAAVACGTLIPLASESDGGVSNDGAVIMPEDSGGVLPLNGDAGDGDVTNDCLSTHAEADGGCDPVIFVTASTSDGNMLGQGQERADNFCTSESSNRSQFRAWLTAEHGNASKRFDSLPKDRPLWLSDGNTMVAPSYNALVSSGPTVAISLDFDGGPIPKTATTWTGSNPSGSDAVTCAGWNSSTGVATYGTPLQVAKGGWAQVSPDGDCGQARSFYCIEMVQ